MKKCEHECSECGEKWECSYPYNSEFQYFKTVVNNGSYCNSYCPSCQPKKRKEVDQLFENLSDTGYLNLSVDHAQEIT